MSQPARGFVLVEAVVASASGVTILLAAAAVLLLSLRAVPEQRDRATGLADALALLDDIARDASGAIAVESTTPLVFLLPGETDDAEPVRVTYTSEVDRGVQHILRTGARGSPVRLAARLGLNARAVTGPLGNPMVEVRVKPAAPGTPLLVRTAPLFGRPPAEPTP